MTATTLSLFLRHLALSEEVGRLGVASDRELLTEYESRRAEAAFTELVRRYGPMVLCTCRRILGRGPDAEDAFQATFLILARKAGSLCSETVRRLSLGAWLHHVAYRTALDVLAKSTRRKARERRGEAMRHPDLDPAAEATWNEVQPILDAELNAPPDEARSLLIACCLQGKTHAEAAAELGVPLGSLAWRLEKARALLAERLARRGVAVTATLLAVLLGELANGAGVPAVLLVHTVDAAVNFAERASAIVSERVAQLVQNGLAKTTKSSTLLSLALVGLISLVGAGWIACQTLMAEPNKKPDAEPPRQTPPINRQKRTLPS